jgi:hypothetical protein
MLGSVRQAGAEPPVACSTMPEELDVDAMIARFKERADAVRRRGLPPVEGAERQRILEQMRTDFQDFAMLADASGKLDDGILTLEIDLRPRQQEK